MQSVMVADQSTADVLVVDDDREINELVGAYAQLAGYGYRAALDGADAVRMANEKTPALVVLDIMLPDTDGFAVCARLKGEPATADVPILMLTALDRDESRMKGRACGAAMYMTKPFDPDRLMAAMKKGIGEGSEGMGSS